MEIIEAVILGIVQGLTEFLPVSSSGHLEIVKALLGDDSLPEESMLMTVVLHGATALSTVIFFRKEILQIIKGLFSFKNTEELHFSLKIILSMIPAAVIGLVFNDEIEALFSSNMLLVGIMLLVTAVLLMFADKAKNTLKEVSYGNAILIGISQAIAILPGISRSGATISTSVLLGVDREKSAKFSFLMVVPLIFGKMANDVKDGAFSDLSGDVLPYIIGFIVALVVGFLACKWMISLVKKAKLIYFSIYCAIVGLAAIIITLVS
jgi:undecaprenyl-diphosphatase